MPNYDGGHYFLSSLIPIKAGLAEADQGDGNSISHIQAIREILAVLPTGSNCYRSACEVTTNGRDPYAQGDLESPFSRDWHTHFCRMVVVDDLTFVGREHQDAIRSAIRKTNPVIPQPVDHLPVSYLALILDFDAPDGSETSLKTYLRGLWSVMEPELGEIFQHCQGFDAADPAGSFLRQVQQGQIETTMSFNDYYWQGEPGFWDGSPALQNRLPEVLLPPLILAALTALILRLAGLTGWPHAGVMAVIALLTILWLYRRVIKAGMQPFPSAPRSDLRAILKALYLQRKFIAFMISNQGCDAKTLRRNFADFLKQHRPQTADAPTQFPGSIPF